MVLLDAIKAYNYHAINKDTEPPKIESPGNITIYANTSFLLIKFLSYLFSITSRYLNVLSE